MISTAALFQFNVGAITWSGVSVSPRSCSVGDTITITVSGGAAVNEYRYGYSINSTNSYTYLSEWISSSTYEYIPTSAGSYYFIVYARDGNSSSNATLPVVTVEGSAESSAESSIPLPFLPSDWEGNAFVQPSAESTPQLDVALPSDIEISVSSGISGILADAFQVFPAPLLALLIPSIIALFIGWWLHK